MDTKTYLTLRNRMTKTCTIYCDRCPLGDALNGSNLSCTDLEHVYPDKAIAAVQKWADEHPECDPDGKTETDPECDPDGETAESFCNPPTRIENHGTLTIYL